MKWPEFKSKSQTTLKSKPKLQHSNLHQSTRKAARLNFGQLIEENHERALRYRSLVGRLLLFAFIAGAAGIAHASRLESAASSAQGTITSIAQISSGIGIAVGGFLMSIGWSSAGRQVLIGAAIGAFASFGGPAVIEAVRSLF